MAGCRHARDGVSPEVAGLLGRLRDRLAAREDVVGVYVYGSLVTGDYSPAASDIDVIVLVRREPGPALTTGDLITKSEAISRLDGFGVPGSLAREIRGRRDGHPVTASKPRWLFRAVLARRIMQNGVARPTRPFQS
jgi:predicted nucleotidyltransferase